MKTTRPRNTPTLLAVLALVLMLGACSDDTTGLGEQISDEARLVSLEMTADALRTDRVLAGASSVELLTDGFAEGLADDAAGLEVELGDELPTTAPMASGAATVGDRLVAARHHTQRAAAKLQLREVDPGKSDPLPGDLLFRYSEQNLDGSVTVISVYQDEPQSVVKIELVTTWPDHHLILSSASETVWLDRGVDYEIEEDDIWLAYEGDVVFANAARLSRSIDQRMDGGIQDGDRVELISRFTPRPSHPRLLQIRTNLVVDVHDLDIEGDDRFVSAERVISFKGIAHSGGSPRIEESITPEQPLAEGEEPCGGELTRDVHFRSDRRLVSWSDRAAWSCDGGGELSRDILFADGSEAYVIVTQGADGIVELDAMNRDGSRTRGSFDEAAGSFEIRTEYASGSDPVAAELAGRTIVDGFEFDAEIEYADGFVEMHHLAATENEVEKRLVGSSTGREGEVRFTLTSNLDETAYSGHVENDLDQTLDFAVEIFEDDSRWIQFTAVDPPVTVVAELMVDAEGCGEGTLTVTEGENRVYIEVSYCDESLVDADQGIELNL